MTYILKTSHLTKTFQGKDVVQDVSMKLTQGEIYGFLGPNGAGKTTVMKMITNLIKPTGGEIELFGEKLSEDSFQVLKRLGSIIEYPFFYERLTAQDNLDLHCEYMGFYDKKAVKDALELVNLQNLGKKQVKDFSLGMKQRLGIARAIITKPDLLILDEPINGLDPVGIKEMRDLFKMLSQQFGITMLVSSHILGEIEQIADTIGVIRSGRLVEEVAMSSIRDMNTEYIELTTSDSRKAAYVLESKLNILNYKVVNEQLIRIYSDGVSRGELAKGLVNENVDIESLTIKKNSLEDYFMELVQGGEGVA
ncbi:ABC transporter ATP-binding protein [Paenibacillus sp. J22TS3]|uniref:ABC transporter ATP-binding protein n=1 Tax=Paenibacillus sp. J22TS3 TaxID=2807192 RepID=UPI001B1CB76E|nr:ABC transporter ATP-binding protein [Paenibacillus sp. J22TS3]GIP23635.1 bacitracin ABC transporter ATP-binding protein [Paenibacillus sp. J22TS3]